MTNEQMTPIRAIRSAIHTLDREKVVTIRKAAERNEDFSEVLADISAEIAALEQAIQQLQQFEALKAALKAVVA